MAKTLLVCQMRVEYWCEMLALRLHFWLRERRWRREVPHA